MVVRLRGWGGCYGAGWPLQHGADARGAPEVGVGPAGRPAHSAEWMLWRVDVRAGGCYGTGRTLEAHRRLGWAQPAMRRTAQSGCYGGWMLGR
eukprot:1176551-Prorocentrum_minimum.AAC.1